jgi:hypothetical protein
LGTLKELAQAVKCLKILQMSEGFEIDCKDKEPWEVMKTA